jgi:hypothetical protein
MREHPFAVEDLHPHIPGRYPDARQDLIRWLPLVKWLLAIPHYIVLFFLTSARSWW